MFQVIETTAHYNRRGDVVRTDRRELFASPCPVACAKFRYRLDPVGGHSLGVNHQRGICIGTERDGQRFGFEAMFRLIEGDDRADRVLSGDLPAQSEKPWVAAQTIEGGAA
jgi:hypothetical protein